MGDVIYGVDFMGQTEARYWERKFDMPRGSYRGWQDGVVLFEDAECNAYKTFPGYIGPDKDPA